MRDVAEQNSDQAADCNQHSPIKRCKIQQTANWRARRCGVSEGRQGEQETREHSDNWRINLLSGPNNHIASEVAHGDNNDPKGDNHEARVDLENCGSSRTKIEVREGTKFDC